MAAFTWCLLDVIIAAEAAFPLEDKTVACAN